MAQKVDLRDHGASTAGPRDGDRHLPNYVLTCRRRESNPPKTPFMRTFILTLQPHLNPVTSPTPT